MMNRKGFTLFEVLIALLILTVALTVCLGGMVEALRFSQKMNERTEAVSQFEVLLFELSSGQRSDLLYYGGKEKMGEGSFEIESREFEGMAPNLSPEKDKSFLAPSYRELHTEVLFHEGKDSLELDTVLGVPVP